MTTRIPRPRALALLGLAAALVASPGCCVMRADTQRGLGYATSTVGVQTWRDARATHELVSDLPAKLDRHLYWSKKNLQVTSTLARGH